MKPAKPQSASWPQAIQAVAFDMDGLLINSEELYFEVFDELLRRRGQRYTHELRRAMMGLPGTQAFAVLIREARLAEDARDLEDECDEIFSGVLPDRLQAMPGALELLDLLQQHQMPHCVATSSRRVFAIDSLSAIGVLERFDFVITAEEVQRGKPFPDIYLAAASRLGVQPECMLVLEDSQHGSRAAVAAGACAVAVPGDHSRDHDFSGVAFVADTLADPRIIQLIKGGK